MAALATCDAHGELDLGGILPGTYLARVYPTRPDLGFAVSEPLPVDPALPAPEAEVRLEAGGCATVLVRDPDGRPLEHAVVLFEDERGAEHGFARLPFTDTEGRLQACGLRPGRYVVHVQLDGYQGTPVSFFHELGRVPEVRVVLSPIPPR
jgi:hypothetical protein